MIVWHLYIEKSQKKPSNIQLQIVVIVLHIKEKNFSLFRIDVLNRN